MTAHRKTSRRARQPPCRRHIGPSPRDIGRDAGDRRPPRASDAADGRDPALVDPAGKGWGGEDDDRPGANLSETEDSRIWARLRRRRNQVSPRLIGQGLFRHDPAGG